MAERIVGFTLRGNRVGGTHHRAKLTDHEIDLIRELFEVHKMTIKDIALKFDIAKSQCFRIVRYHQRATTPVTWREKGKKPPR